MFSRSKSNMNIETLLNFMKDFNYWIAQKSEEAGMLHTNADKKLPLEERVQPIYPYIKISNWIVLASINQ